LEHNDLFVCSLSGVEAADEVILPDELADDLGLLPVGWTRLTIDRRLPNTDWHQVQSTKALLVAAATEQIPEDQQSPETVTAIQIQIEAQYAALEARMSPFLNMKEVIFIAPPEMDQSLADEFYGLREALGLPVPETEEEEEKDEELPKEES